MSIAGGEEERCPCTNATGTLASLSERNCLLPSGDVGVHLTLGGSCVPFSYGSSHCLRHDLLHDPACSGNDAPVYCLRTWCYVDPVTCKRDSEHRLFRSSYFSHESEIDLFFSYSACNATADEWFRVEDELVGNHALGGVSILATVPTYMKPMMYKRDIVTGEILSSPGSEYYDDSIPYEGVYPTYVDRLVEIANGDIQNITVTHRSKASGVIHPQSSFTAAVQDLKDGLVDMAIGPFWITGERLQMSAFTIPIVDDQTFLVIPKPEKKDTLGDQAMKVTAPFSIGMWGLLFGIIVLTALLSVWFSDRFSTEVTAQTDRRSAWDQTRAQPKRRRLAYARLALDSFLQKGLFFCSAGVEQDEGGTLPNQVLMFGFGAFILIAVSAYVANLAAFLTLSSAEAPIETMADAVKSGVAICAHPALKAELKVAWPDANFYFHMEGREFPGVLEDYKNGKCGVMAVGWEDTGSDTGFLENLCKQNLVYTKSLVVQTPIAFPIRPALASGISYWIHQGKIYHETSIELVKEEFAKKISCDIHFIDGDTEASELDPIQARNMLLPLTIFLSCLALAVLLQLWHQHDLNKGNRSLIGRRSTLELVANLDGEAERIKRRLLASSKEDEDIEGEGGGEVGEEIEGDKLHQNTSDQPETSHNPLMSRGSSLDLVANSDSSNQNEMVSQISWRSPISSTGEGGQEAGGEIEGRKIHQNTGGQLETSHITASP